MESNFSKFLNDRNGLATHDTEDIRSEFFKRELITGRFPLEVFNPSIKPFITALNQYYNIPSSFIGLSLLSAFSTAIGTGYTVSTNRKDSLFLPVWGALVGISSSGKSTAMKHLYGPHNEIQDEFDNVWQQKTQGLSNEKINQQKMDTVMFRDSHVPTLIRSVLPDNPKGVVKFSDELLEWINGMNQLSRKEGTDEQFWVSSWNCTNYNAIRSGKQKVVIQKPFVNIIGGTQYKLLPRFFAHDRDTSGFIFRLLFALPEVDKIAEPDLTFEMPDGFSRVYSNSIKRLYHDIPMHDASYQSKKCILNPDAIKLYTAWAKEKATQINGLQDSDDQSIQAGILGKIKEYALRFTAILHLVDRSLDQYYGNDFHTNFKAEEHINTDVMEKALTMADYFYQSAIKINEKVQVNITAPPEVLMAATMLKLGRTQSEIAERLYGEEKHKMRVCRNLKKWIKEYPRVFNALAR